MKLFLAALLAVCLALRADIGTPPLPEDVRAIVSWLLTGISAGLTVLLGPELADAVKSLTTKSKQDITKS